MSEPIPRPEHPRPQFYRPEWLNLNGVWTFEFDFSESGDDLPECSPCGVTRGGFTGASRDSARRGLFDREILVPFCPESPRSGVGFTDFIPAMYYARKFTVPTAWRGRRVILHFGGVDCETGVFIDGNPAGRHRGGQSSFEFDITRFVRWGGEQLLTVQAVDHQRNGEFGCGKQSSFHRSFGCRYTRVTGIWSTVWLEAAGMRGLKRCRIVPDYDGGNFIFTPEFHALSGGEQLEIELLADGGRTAFSVAAAADGVPRILTPAVRREWNPDDPFLYDVKFRVRDAAGNLLDEVTSYAGLRKIAVHGNRIFLNNQPFFPRFVLDQGYYPDGVWTAPDDAALTRDIELSKAAGFNGARLHQKVFEERYFYHADRLGYLVWGEYGSWGLNFSDPRARENFLAEWREVVARDVNHPSVIVWCPLNETVYPNPISLAQKFPTEAALRTYRNWVDSIYELTRALDPTRPVNDASGFVHVRTDLWSVHCYSRDRAELTARLRPASGGVMVQAPEYESGYCGQPYLCNEFGGFKYIPPDRRGEASGWGYHDLELNTVEELTAKIEEQVNWLIDAPEIAGYCYTQLTDVEQEQNGIYNYDRTEKFSPEQMRRIFGRKPKWSRF